MTITTAYDMLSEAIEAAKEHGHETTVAELMQLLEDACEAEEA